MVAQAQATRVETEDPAAPRGVRFDHGATKLSVTAEPYRCPAFDAGPQRPRATERAATS